MYYIISGWDNKGNQIVETHKALSEIQACAMFISSIGGGEVNEILDTITDEEYEAEMRKDAGKGNNMNTKRNYNRYDGIKCIETGKIYTSVSEAARELNISAWGIYEVLRGKLATTKGYHFERVENDNEPKEVIIQRKAVVYAKGKRCNGNTNAVVNLTKAKMYTSAKDAAEDVDVTPAYMSTVCRSEKATAKGNRCFYLKDLPEHADEFMVHLNKAVMYDELMTRKEKYEQLRNNLGEAECKVKCIEYDIERLHEQLKQAHLEVEKAKHDLMHFEW